MSINSVPVIDLQDFYTNRDDFVQVLGNAIKELGFVRVKGHNVTSLITNPAYQKAKEFFALPEAKKIQYKIIGGAGQRGYTPYLSESAKNSHVPDLKEFWHIGRELAEEHRLHAIYPPNVWPTEIEGFRTAMLALYDALEECSNILLRGPALFLGQEEDHFTSITKEGNTILRSLYYPALKDRKPVPGAIRAAAHEDINFITLLITSTSSGLQLLTREGEWLDVNAQPGEIVADSGDMLSRVTNGLIPATTHRVINPNSSNSERYSLPFFVHPRPQSLLSVLDNCKGEGFPVPPPDITGIDFLNERLQELGLDKL